jgi:hypothetical protein
MDCQIFSVKRELSENCDVLEESELGKLITNAHQERQGFEIFRKAFACICQSKHRQQRRAMRLSYLSLLWWYSSRMLSLLYGASNGHVRTKKSILQIVNTFKKAIFF